MDIERNLRIVSQIRRDTQEQGRKNYIDKSQERLKKSIDKKFRTTFIGALDHFEKTFGYSWGHNLPESKLTDTQIRIRELWIQVRTSILNNGNNQLRAAMSEIEEYTVEWNRFHNNITVRKDNQ
jgi:hypothetical protein